MQPPKFTLRIGLNAFHETGLKALDFRRAMGLPEGLSARALDGYGDDVNVDVPEGFARTWFGNHSSGRARVQVEWLTPGELIPVMPGGFGPDDVLQLNPEMPAGRVQELYIRARFAALQEELAEAQAEIQEAEEAVGA